MNNSFNFTTLTVRPAAILTNSYVAGTVLGTDTTANLEYNSTLILDVDFTLGSLTTGEIIVEFSNDGTTYYQETIDAVNTSTGIITEKPAIRTFGATGKYRMTIPVMDKFIKISAHGTGTVAGSSMSIVAAVGR